MARSATAGCLIPTPKVTTGSLGRPPVFPEDFENLVPPPFRLFPLTGPPEHLPEQNKGFRTPQGARKLEEALEVPAGCLPVPTVLCSLLCEQVKDSGSERSATILSKNLRKRLRDLLPRAAATAGKSRLESLLAALWQDLRDLCPCGRERFGSQLFLAPAEKSCQKRLSLPAPCNLGAERPGTHLPNTTPNPEKSQVPFRRRDREPGDVSLLDSWWSKAREKRRGGSALVNRVGNPLREHQLPFPAEEKRHALAKPVRHGFIAPA